MKGLQLNLTNKAKLMNQNNKRFLLAGLIGLIVTTAMISGLVNAAEPSENPSSAADYPRMQPRMANFDPETQQAIEQAIENSDYATWAELVGNKPIAEKITAENFDQLQAMHQLRQQAREKMQAADEIAKELGIERRGPMIKGEGGFGQHRGDCQAAK